MAADTISYTEGDFVLLPGRSMGERMPAVSGTAGTIRRLYDRDVQ